MERAARISDKPVHWHRASQLRLHAENPGKNLPQPKRLAGRPDPEGAWPATLSNPHRGLDDTLPAAAAMKAPVGLNPYNGDLAVKLIRL